MMNGGPWCGVGTPQNLSFFLRNALWLSQLHHKQHLLVFKECTKCPNGMISVLFNVYSKATPPDFLTTLSSVWGYDFPCGIRTHYKESHCLRGNPIKGYLTRYCSYDKQVSYTHNEPTAIG